MMVIGAFGSPSTMSSSAPCCNRSAVDGVCARAMLIDAKPSKASAAAPSQNVRRVITGSSIGFGRPGTPTVG